MGRTRDNTVNIIHTHSFVASAHNWAETETLLCLISERMTNTESELNSHKHLAGEFLKVFHKKIQVSR